MPSFSAKPAAAPRHIVFVLFDQTKLIDVTGPLQVFNDAELPSGQKAYRITLTSAAGGPVDTDAPITLETLPLGTCTTDPPDTLIISGGDSALQAANSLALQAQLAEIAPRCRRLASVCLGAFILAKGGYLNGLRAATHWESCADLQNDYPKIKVQQDSIYEEDHGVWTSAGVTAGIDMALAMVEQDLGRSEALRLAQSLVLYMKRGGGQRQFSAALKSQIHSKGGKFDHLLAHVVTNLANDLSVPKLAIQAHMSERNFARAFTATIGISPARFVEEQRVAAACEALQRGEVSLADLPHRFGFGNPERLRRAFQRAKGISPSDYRERFGLEAQQG